MSHDSWLMSDTVFVKYYSIAFSILPGIAGGLALELIGAMREVGLSQDEIAAYTGGNFLLVLNQCLN